MEERYREYNDPPLYLLQREIASIAQGNSSVVAYYTRLKCLWDELAVLMPSQECDCGFAKSASEITSFNHLMQFLIALNEAYDHVRNQILLIEPFPSVNRAYSMILRVEKQRQVSLGINEVNDQFTMQIRVHEQKRDGNFRNTDRKYQNLERKLLYCDNCDRTGHVRERASSSMVSLTGTKNYLKK